ncbi:MAG: hypothetical protein VKK59_07895 [Vampirovibrionales bacterium]|nr:hypothetical protein [Vampirovibrionales bacterium]
MAVNPFAQAKFAVQSASSLASLAPTSAIARASGLNPFVLNASEVASKPRPGVNAPLFGGPMLLGRLDGKDIYAGGRLYVQV